MNHLFVYGTLMLPEISERIFGRFSNETAILKNYQSHKLVNNGEELFYPALIEKDGAKTKGILFRNLTNQQLKLIDEYEGDEYERRMVEIEVENETLNAWCYIWNTNLHFVLKGDWSVEWFKENFLTDFLADEL